MKASDPAFEEEDEVRVQDDLRQQIGVRFTSWREQLTGDAAGLFQFSGADALDEPFCGRLATMLVDLFTVALRDGSVDSSAERLHELVRLVGERALPTDRLYTCVYLLERAALDELALDDDLGATSEPWPTVAQMVRRGSFDVLAAYTDRAMIEPRDAALTDRLTTLFTWPVFKAALEKELERASRYGESVSLILFDIDRLGTINEEYGFGVGDRVLERVAILIRKYFRQHDWVARQHDDSLAVLLGRSDPDIATALAERARHTVEERIEFRDHKTDRLVLVTVSVAVVNVSVPIGSAFDPERLIVDAAAAMERAKLRGGNSAERVDLRAAPLSAPPARQLDQPNSFSS